MCMQQELLLCFCSFLSGNALVCGEWGSEVQILGPLNWTQCCQRLVTAATFLRNELDCPDAITRRLAPPTQYALRRNTCIQRVKGELHIFHNFSCKQDLQK